MYGLLRSYVRSFTRWPLNFLWLFYFLGWWDFFLRFTTWPLNFSWLFHFLGWWDFLLKFTTWPLNFLWLFHFLGHKTKKKYLHDYWYSLKYLVHALHAAYRLLYKVLGKYGNTSMCWRNKHHHLIKGPRTIAKNLAIFSDLVAFVDIQVCLIGSII